MAGRRLKKRSAWVDGRRGFRLGKIGHSTVVTEAEKSVQLGRMDEGMSIRLDGGGRWPDGGRKIHSAWANGRMSAHSL